MSKPFPFFFLLLTLLAPQDAFCQKNGRDTVKTNAKEPLPLKIKIKYADALFRAGNYYDAINEYSEIIEMKPDNYRAMYQMGECYFMARDYVNAEKWYEKPVDAGADAAFPLVYYRLAMAQKMQGNYEKAKYTFAKFALRAEGDYITRAKREIEACDFAKTALEIPSLFTVTHLDSVINSPYSEYAPAVDNGKLYYSSLNRDTAMNPAGKFLSHIYLSEKNSNAWGKGVLLPQPLNSSQYHTGNIAFSPDGKRVYFTQCSDNGEANIQCTILRAARDGDRWMQPAPLTRLHAEGFSNTHPAVAGDDSADVVYFSSNRPGGFGGFDLWYTEVKPDGSASAPVNLGSAVNTIDDEVTPFFHKNKLYFSSNGHIGLGGLDVFVSSGLKMGWSKPQNLGYPLNSSADDFYFTKGESPKTYYFVSNRAGIIGLKSPTCCDDIFMAKDLSIPKFTVKGRVLEKGDTLVPLTGVRAEVFKDSSEIRTPLHDKQLLGDFTFSFELLAGKNYEMKIQKKGYFPQTIKINAKDNPEPENISRDIILEKIEKNKAYRLDKIYYDFNKSSLTEESKETLRKLYELLMENPKLVVEISSHTDDVGKPQYNLKLSQERAQSVVDYLIYLGIEEKRLIPKGYGESQPVAPNKNPDGSDNEAGRQQNRRTEFKVIGELSRVGDKIIYD
ncbi:MAG TPA: OmpA family protein [Chitinophagales bacterium]|nr:OmpA family protein [Chitinophagales bacterium]